MTLAPPEGRRPLRDIVLLRRVVLSVVLAAAFVTLIWGLNLHQDPDPAAGLPVSIGALAPKPASPNVAPQSTVFYELVPGYNHLSLTIEGTQIPDDQVDRIQVGRTRISFSPGPGKALGQLPKGLVRVNVAFARAADTTTLYYSWNFNVG